MACRVCKPRWTGTLHERTVAKIEWTSTSDENHKVRLEATAAIGRHAPTDNCRR